MTLLRSAKSATEPSRPKGYPNARITKRPLRPTKWRIALSCLGSGGNRVPKKIYPA